MVDQSKIQAMYDYMIKQQNHFLEKSDGCFGFCREDPLVAEKIAQLFNKKLIEYAMLTGGLGKDSGNMCKKFGSEAQYQANLLINKYNISSENLIIEPNANNGYENITFGLKKIIESNKEHFKLILSVHPTSLRRIQNLFNRIIRDEFPNLKVKLQWTTTNYKFDSSNPIDQIEVMEELLRLADWPSKGWITIEYDLPKDLVDYAREHIQSIKTK